MPAAEGSHWGMGGARTDGEGTVTGPILYFLKEIFIIMEKMRPDKTESMSFKRD